MHGRHSMRPLNARALVNGRCSGTRHDKTLSSSTATLACLDRRQCRQLKQCFQLLQRYLSCSTAFLKDHNVSTTRDCMLGTNTYKHRVHSLSQSQNW